MTSPLTKRSYWLVMVAAVAYISLAGFFLQVS
jgi:hypothetical protein